MNDYPQSAMSALGLGGLTSAFNFQSAAGYNNAQLQNIAQQQNMFGMQQAAFANLMRLSNAGLRLTEPKLNRAQRIASEVRQRHPEMQVKRLTRQVEK